MEIKKVSKNHTTLEFVDGNGWSNIPIRLELASRILGSVMRSEKQLDPENDCRAALDIADTLIDTHNRDVRSGKA